MPPRIPGTNVTFIDSNNDGLDIVTYGESILFTCQPGYNMAGGDVIKTCLGNGTFSGIDLQCMPVRCHDIPIIANTQSYYTDVNLDGDTVVSFREVVTYECTMGYFLMSGDQERRCQQNGSFSGTDVVCEALMCHIPPIPHTTHTFLMHNENLTYLHEVEYVCDYGYRTNSGDSVRMCQADGSISGQNLDCKPVTCAYVPDIPQTNISYVDLNRDGKDIVTFGETVTYHCQKGYLRSAAGNETRFCMADGTLNGTDVACYAIRCLDVPLLPYSTMTSTDSNDDGEEIISYREAANYQCLQGYYRKSGSERRICQSSGSLDGEDLVCAPRQCNIIPVPENTEYFSEDTNNDGQDTVTFTEVVHYVCRNGFFPMGGNLKRTCQHDGQLNGTDLYCKAVDCKAPPKVENAVVMVIETSLGSVAHYFCNAGYQSQGRHTFSGECSKNGDWIGEFTDCSGVFCKPPAPIPNAVTSVGNHAAKPWGSYINITCLPGYLMEHVTGGVVTWTCQGNGSWEGLKVSCKAIDDRPSRSNGNQSYDWIIFVIAVVCATVLIAIMVAAIAILTDKRRRISTKMRRLRREYESSSLSSPPLSSRGTPSCLSDRNLLAGGLPLAYPGGMFVSEASKEMYEDIWRWYKISDAENLADDRNDTGTRAHFNQFAEAPLYMHSVDGLNRDLNENDFIEPTNTEQRISQVRDWGNSMLQQRGTNYSRDSSPGNQFRLDDAVIPKQWEEESMRPEEEIIIYEDLSC
ncbi:CUB and sushi domain-containing protein 2-like [Lingula anatina]|uniref:CUB and sushi domain-containing protein 2-like n=1 Tax=Lingula anatina TaxID=7574 RepID=A0A2R2MNB8_LINAN|nr:CUB and sushi domain-containing protein 2-like [Lingula anatina]|eukprot:XP_023931706.1 CUB and sushi domain-containing protein 2-like [Lingula anatina]